MAQVRHSRKGNGHEHHPHRNCRCNLLRALGRPAAALAEFKPSAALKSACRAAVFKLCSFSLFSMDGIHACLKAKKLQTSAQCQAIRGRSEDSSAERNAFANLLHQHPSAGPWRADISGVSIRTERNKSRPSPLRCLPAHRARNGFGGFRENSAKTPS